jgi:hypothetical protein
MKRKKTEIEEHESSLDREEKVLEGIRDSLKGTGLCFLGHGITQSLICVRSQTRPKYFTTRSK